MHLPLLLIAAFLASQVEPVRVPVTNECGGNTSFVGYRRHLIEAVEGKDVAALQSLVAPNVMVSFGGDEGWDRFVRKWGLDRPHGSKVWQELRQLLALGCSDSNGIKFMPMNFADFGEGDPSIPPYWAVNAGTAFSSQPSDTAPVEMPLDHHLLYELEDGAPEGWLHARLSNGKAGYVRRSAVRSAIDYRATFEFRDGKWLMTSFLAGD